MGASDQARSGTQSIERACAILRVLMDRNREGATSIEVAACAAVERTTAHRMLRCLVDERLASQDPGTKRYHLGSLAYALGIAAAARADLRTVARPLIAKLAAETEDTVFLIARSGDDSVCIDRAEGTYPVKTFVVDVGTRRPLGVGAGSLAILSALPAEDADAVIGRNRARLQKQHGITATRLRTLMLGARSAGHVAMDVVDVQGVRAVGVAVCDAGGHVVGALSIAAVQWRMTRPREAVLIARLRQEAGALAASLAGAHHKH